MSHPYTEENIVTITSQGQLTIPRGVRKHFGITGSTKARLRTDGHRIVVEPQNDFWSLSGSLRSPVRLTDRQLKAARGTFGKKWARAV